MPIYEYRCSSCGHELEALQKFSDAALTTCPSCRAEALVKQMSAGGFQLKGSGWYATDFKGGGSKPAPASESGGATAEVKPGSAAAAKGESPGAAKSDAKAETKSGPVAPASGSGPSTAST